MVERRPLILENSCFKPSSWLFFAHFFFNNVWDGAGPSCKVLNRALLISVFTIHLEFCTVEPETRTGH